MPIYEYRCENGHLTERFQRMSDPELAECDVCAGSVKKVLHPVSIHFKGSGFYNTDYGRGKGAATTDTKSTSEGGSSSSASESSTKASSESSSSSSSAGDGGSSSSSGSSTPSSSSD